MPTNRFGYSDDFVLNNGKVGINSASPQEKLDVVGITKAENLSVVGVSSLTGYEGFLRANHNIAESTSLEGGQGITGSLSGEIVIGTGVTVTGIASATSGQGYIDSLKVYNTFTVPVGLTVDRPTAPKPGQLYYNKDFASIEFFDGDRWRQVDNTTQRGRGVWAGGYQSGITPTSTAGISYIQISTLGNSVNFGSLTTAGQDAWGCSSSTRGLFGGRFNGNAIEYITIASEGNSIDFGDLAQTTGGINYAGALSSSTRGIWAGGQEPTSVNIIQYVTIATIGNTLDFGDLTKIATPNGSGLSSPTRGLFVVSDSPSSVNSSLINAITISSTGNAVEFGNLTTKNEYTNASGFSNSTRGIWGSRQLVSPGGVTNTIDYVTISTFGNAVDFGDATISGGPGGAVASSTRGVFCVGLNPALSPGLRDQNVLNYVTIASTGDAIDFGDLTRSGNSYSRHTGPVSDSHGGLGGF